MHAFEMKQTKVRRRLATNYGSGMSRHSISEKAEIIWLISPQCSAFVEMAAGKTTTDVIFALGLQGMPGRKKSIGLS